MSRFVVFFIVLSVSFSSYGAADPGEKEAKLMRSIISLENTNGYKPLTLRYLFQGRARDTGYVNITEQAIITACNGMFVHATDSVFHNKSYFLKVFGLNQEIGIEGPRDRETLEKIKKNRAAVVRAFDNTSAEGFSPDFRGKCDVFRLLLELDEAQDSENRTKVTQLIISAFENTHASLALIKAAYLGALEEDLLKVFIKYLSKDSALFSKRSVLLDSLLDRYKDRPHFQRAYWKINGKLAEIRAKNTTVFSLCLSGVSCCAWITGGCLALVYNSSKTSFSGSEIISDSSHVTNSSAGTSSIINTTESSATVLWNAEKVTAPISQIGSVMAPFSLAVLYGYKFLHDLSFRRVLPTLTPALQWLALYSIDEDRSDFIAGKLEDAVQSQFWFFGRQTSSFVREVIAAIDVMSI